MERDGDSLEPAWQSRRESSSREHRAAPASGQPIRPARPVAGELRLVDPHLGVRVLAAAYAEAGDFARAVERARAAIELARAEHSDAEVRIYEAQLAGYRARRPYRLP